MKKVEAVALFKSEHALAQALGVSRQAVNQWGVCVPKHRALEIEKLRWKPGSVLARQCGCQCPRSPQSLLAAHYVCIDERCPLHGFNSVCESDNADE